MADVTIVVLTKNEEINLPDCLESVKGFAKRVVVVDSGSTDRTEEIAKTYGADFYVHPFEILQQNGPSVLMLTKDLHQACAKSLKN
jgi:glycosyltransferase involved in cell wall biosynthesis